MIDSLSPSSTSDILSLWGNVVDSISDRLKIKYGLGHTPTDSQVTTWVTRTQANINRGLEKEEAGALAARDTFSDYRTHHYRSEADTIVMLLRLAERK
jgi:hypothetical protein